MLLIPGVVFLRSLISPKIGSVQVLIVINFVRVGGDEGCNWSSNVDIIGGDGGVEVL